MYEIISHGGDILTFQFRTIFPALTAILTIPSIFQCQNVGPCDLGDLGAQFTDAWEKMNVSQHDFVFLSESSVRANLIRIALGRDT